MYCTLGAIGLSVVTGVAVKACADPDLVETFGEKSEWSVLQIVESQERTTALSEPVVRTINEHEVLGVKGLSGENLWILLKPSSPPFYKQMPEGNYALPVALVKKLESERRLSYTVTHVLRSHVRQE